MRQTERDVLLILLAVAAGSADGCSYFGLGHAFVANMTGNTVLLGIAVSLHRDLLHPGISLICYVAGAALAALLTRDVREVSGWPRAVSRTLALESALMIAAAIGWAIVGRSPVRPGSTPVLNLLLGCVGFAVGIQSGAMLQLKIPGVVTTYITGTWTTLTSGVTRFLATQQHQPPKQKVAYEERVLMQAGCCALTSSQQWSPVCFFVMPGSLSERSLHFQFSWLQCTDWHRSPDLNSRPNASKVRGIFSAPLAG